MFKVGQKVVCINDSGFSHQYGEQVPVLGRSYTVRAVVGPCIRLREIVNVPQRYAGGTVECSFTATRFKRGK
jgi:hypothetical protein